MYMDNNKADMIDESKYNDVLGAMNRRYQLKKIANIRISILIVILGVSSFIFGLRLEPSVTIFRFMTVDGKVFTTKSAFLAVIANIVELKNNTEDTSRFVYFSRLSLLMILPSADFPLRKDCTVPGLLPFMQSLFSY